MRPFAGLALSTTLAVAVATSSAACFPTNPRARHVAYAAEVGAMVTGVLVLAMTPADCDRMDATCRSHATLGNTVGLGLLIGGLTGATLSVATAEDHDDAPIITPTSTATPGASAAPAGPGATSTTTATSAATDPTTAAPTPATASAATAPSR